MMWWILSTIAYFIVGAIVARITYLSGVFSGGDLWKEDDTALMMLFWPLFVVGFILVGILVCIRWPFELINEWVTHPTRKQREEMQRLEHERAEENRVRSDTPQW